MNGKQVIQKMNGKKRYVAGGIGAAVTMPFLISFLFNLNTTVSATATQVEVNTKVIEELTELPERMRGVEVAQMAIKEKLDDSITRQEKVNDKVLDKLDKLLAK